MAKSIIIQTPYTGILVYIEGQGDVEKIVVKYSFSNVVDVTIYFGSLPTIKYYQCSCMVLDSSQLPSPVPGLPLFAVNIGNDSDVNGILKTSSGKIAKAIAGTDYQAPQQNVLTSDGAAVDTLLAYFKTATQVLGITNVTYDGSRFLFTAASGAIVAPNIRVGTSVLNRPLWNNTALFLNPSQTISWCATSNGVIGTNDTEIGRVGIGIVSIKKALRLTTYTGSIAGSNPTAAEIASITSLTAAAAGDGFLGILRATGAPYDQFIISCDGTNFYYQKLTKAV
jgi:hypothetical protein